ncbi:MULTISPECIES: hypothetical protein [unclassified Beijerinckia]|uniref:hypothetical protein n=1 Tax=unclassified Beijerinckia TaxID=2638183 RepID=UPI000898104A|nr:MULTISPECIES: hypothetical protein [unclassified Beijerinckia]MDH7794074.1 hypothetical protein [Beijerinckia sp. GAS462]SEB52713.1 hypothetical protein SAMN05443249_0340 [Beijerinckia sp. 28-YEA-48]
MALLFNDQLMADYHQFYLADAAIALDMPTDYSETTLRARMLIGNGMLIAMTERNMPVPVRVESHDIPPIIDIAAADHVVIGSLHTSGEIVLAGLTDHLPTAPRLQVPPGDLRVMVVSTGLGTLSTDGLTGDDRYTLHLWPGPVQDVTVLRQWDVR